MALTAGSQALSGQRLHHPPCGPELPTQRSHHVVLHFCEQPDRPDRASCPKNRGSKRRLASWGQACLEKAWQPGPTTGRGPARSGSWPGSGAVGQRQWRVGNLNQQPRAPLPPGPPPLVLQPTVSMVTERTSVCRHWPSKPWTMTQPLRFMGQGLDFCCSAQRGSETCPVSHSIWAESVDLDTHLWACSEQSVRV